jgi:hypothetical protein
MHGANSRCSAATRGASALARLLRSSCLARNSRFVRALFSRIASHEESGVNIFVGRGCGLLAAAAVLFYSAFFYSTRSST